VAGGGAKPLLETGDAYKDEVQRQWNANPCGSQYVQGAEEHTLDWFLEVERYRYEDYAPWMPETMEFSRWADRNVLEIGGGIGTDLSQFAANGAIVTDYDLSAGHLALAEENFGLRGLKGEFVHGDAGTLPFENDRFDLVYSNGVIHHTPDTQRAVGEILRVLRPGGKVIVMVYAEHSLHYWRGLVGKLGLDDGLLAEASIGEIMSRHVEISATRAKPLVKVYSARRLRRMFDAFDDIDIVKRQLTPAERPRGLRWAPADVLEKVMGWNLVIKAYKPAPSNPA
jgi:SAM-dependent methyltransferase